MAAAVELQFFLKFFALVITLLFIIFRGLVNIRRKLGRETYQAFFYRLSREY